MLEKGKCNSASVNALGDIRGSSSLNHFSDILELFDVLPIFFFTTSEMMRDYSYKHGKYELSRKLLNK